MKKQKLTKEQEKIKLNTIKNNMVYQEELDGVNYNVTDEEILNQKQIVKDHLIATLEKDDTLILDDDYFILILAILTCKNEMFKIKDLKYCDILERYSFYKEGINFFDDPNAFKILEEYGAIIKKDTDGYYNLDDTIVNKVIKNNDFYITDEDMKDTVKQEIFNNWENQTEILTQDKLDDFSEQRNGINFKYFIFCEEYIKTGKIKPTCEHLGISRNTAYLWLKKDEVQQYLTNRQEEIRKETDNTFIKTYWACFNELDKMVNSSFIQNGDKIKAIDTFLKHYENLERIKQPINDNK